MRNLKKLLFAVALVATTIAATAKTASAVDWCAQCDATGDCFACCRCDGFGPGYCAWHC